MTAWFFLFVDWAWGLNYLMREMAVLRNVTQELGILLRILVTIWVP
jgi:hypothetical protein